MPIPAVIPASPDTDTSLVSGRDGGPARPCARSQGRGYARPASEGSLDESPSRLDGIRENWDGAAPFDNTLDMGQRAEQGDAFNGQFQVNHLRYFLEWNSERNVT